MSSARFNREINDWLNKVDGRKRALFVNVASAVQESVRSGSQVTSAPGQPVATGNLKTSWNLEFESATTALISTNVEYAPPIEAGVGPYGPLTLRSEVGGFGSVKLTRTGFQRLVNDEARKLGAPA